MTQEKATTILLIEDSPSDTRLIKESLSDAPHDSFHVITASTLAKGLRKLERDSVDAVLLDLALPDSDGVSTFRAVRTLKPSLPIVVLTMTDDDALGLQMVGEGVQDYLPKTVLTQETSMTALTHAIRYAIERKRVEVELQKVQDVVQTLNKQLYSKNEELEQRIDERTTELEITGKQLAAANEELRHEVEHRTIAEQMARTHAHQQDILTRIISAGNSATSLQSALVAMLDTALELLNLDSGGIFLRDGDTMTLQYERGYTAEQRTWTQRIPITQRRVAQIMDGTPWISDDYQADATPEVREMNKEVASMATVPLMAGDAVVGFYQLVSLRHSRHFTDEERNLLVSIGKEAGTVISRLLAEQALKQSEARLNKLVEQSFDAVFIHSGGIVRFANGVAAHILKAARPEDLIGMDALAFPTDAFRELVKKRIASTYETHAKTEPVEMQFKTVDGDVVDVESMATDTVWEGKPAVYVAFRDITEKKRAGKELKRYAERLEDLVEERTAQLAQSEEYFRTLFEASSIAQVRFDKGGQAVRINASMKSLLGITDVKSLRRFNLFTSPRVPQKVKHTLKAGKTARYELTYDFTAMREREDYPTTRSDVRHVDYYVLPLFDRATGTIDGYLAQLVDITERKWAEARLKASEEQYRTLVETANSLIFTLDNEGTITYVNDYGARCLGYTPNELIGQNVMLIVPEIDSSGRAMSPYINDIVAHPDEHTVSLNENVTKDGRRVWINWVNKMLTDEHDRHVGHLAIGNDVTEQIHAEAALRDAQRLAGIGETAAMIGHDLRNPLQGLQYIVDLQKLRFERMSSQKQHTKDWEHEAQLFDRISEQIFYMDKIVGDLQDYARPITPEHEEITISAIINDVLESVPLAYGVETVINVSDATFVVDPHLMIRVFSNLILNAVQAMPKGGTLTIGAEATDGSVAIRVSDTGVGIAAEMRDKLFSPLTTGKAKGTGLGLAVVKRIVEAHNGTITFESEEGKGTTFTVTLPQTAE